MAERKCRNCRFFENGTCTLNGKRTSPIYSCGHFVEY